MVNVTPARLLSQPASNLLNALNSEARWEVEGGMTYCLTLCNAPAAVAQFVGRVDFVYSTDGATWNALKAMPLTTPTAQVATSSTGVGIWLVDVPNGGSVYLAARMGAYTSGSVYACAVPYGLEAASVQIPWTYTVTAGQTLIGPIDTSGLAEIDLQISVITTTVLTAQGTNDPSLTTWDTIPVQDVKALGIGALTIATASTYRISCAGYKYTRVQCTTTGTVLTVIGASASFGQQMLLNGYGVSGSVNLQAVAGQAFPAIDGVFAMPFGQGLRAANANPAAMSANGDIVGALATMIGALISKPYSIPEADWQYTGQITVTTDTVIKAAAAAGIRNYCTALQLQNTGASASLVTIKDGATVIWQGNLAAGMSAPIAVPLPTPLKGTAATALNINSSVATTIIANAQGYSAP